MLRSLVRRVVPLTAVLVLSVFASPSTAAVPNVTFAEFSTGITGAVGTVPGTITAGPDGNVWFTQFNPPSVGKITPAGAVTQYPLASGHNPYGIVAGPDGNLWVAIDATSVFDPFQCQFNGGTDKIAKVTISGQVTEYDTATPHGKPNGITVGADGALWFGLSGYLCTNAMVIGGSGMGRITTAGVASAFTIGFDPQEGTSSVAAGPDGRIWFTDLYHQQIGAITTAGAVTHYDLGPTQFGSGITAGPDGAMWFAINRASGAIGRATTTGSLAYYTQGLPAQFDVWDITTGPDGALWFVGGDNGLGQITTAGAITMVPGMSANTNPGAVALGPSGTNTLWYGGALALGRVTFPAPPTTTTTVAPTPLNPTTTVQPVSAVPRFTG